MWSACSWRNQRIEDQGTPHKKLCSVFQKSNFFYHQQCFRIVQTCETFFQGLLHFLGTCSNKYLWELSAIAIIPQDIIIIIIIVIILWLVVSKIHMYKTWKCCHKDRKTSGELRNGALQIWRGVVCFSGDFTFYIILNSISTPHKPSFFIITNVLSESRDLSHLFLTFFQSKFTPLYK